MAENRNGIENRDGAENRFESAYPTRETNGDARMKNISPSTLPHFHGLTSEDPNTFCLSFLSYAELMSIPLMTRS